MLFKIRFLKSYQTLKNHVFLANTQGQNINDLWYIFDMNSVLHPSQISVRNQYGQCTCTCRTILMHMRRPYWLPTLTREEHSIEFLPNPYQRSWILCSWLGFVAHSNQCPLLENQPHHKGESPDSRYTEATKLFEKQTLTKFFISFTFFPGHQLSTQVMCIISLKCEDATKKLTLKGNCCQNQKCWDTYSHVLGLTQEEGQ